MTPKQERFVQEYLKDLNATQAAIRAGYSEKTAEQLGYQLLQKTSVKEALAKVQEQHAQEAGITVQSHLQELARLRALAEDSNQISAAIKAEELRGRVTGLYVERAENLNLNMDVTDEPMTEEEWEREHADVTRH